MRLDEIHDEWAKDSPIDETELDADGRRIPLLHAKYLRYLSGERMTQRKLENELQVLESEVSDRLTGVMTQEDLAARNWQPERRRFLRSEVGGAVASDKDVMEMKLRLALQVEKVAVLDSICRMIMNRNYVLKGIADWIKFKSGVS